MATSYRTIVVHRQGSRQAREYNMWRVVSNSRAVTTYLEACSGHAFCHCAVHFALLLCHGHQNESTSRRVSGPRHAPALAIYSSTLQGKAKRNTTKSATRTLASAPNGSGHPENLPTTLQTAGIGSQTKIPHTLNKASPPLRSARHAHVL